MYYDNKTRISYLNKLDKINKNFELNFLIKKSSFDFNSKEKMLFLIEKLEILK